jgi:hypothetical protein
MSGCFQFFRVVLSGDLAIAGRPLSGLSIRAASAGSKISLNTSLAGLALAKTSALHSGLSLSVRPGLRRLLMVLNLSPIGFTQTDDMHWLFSARKEPPCTRKA